MIKYQPSTCFMPLWDGPPPPRVPRNQKEAGKASGVRTDPQHRGLAAKKFNESVNLDALQQA